MMIRRSKSATISNSDAPAGSLPSGPGAVVRTPVDCNTCSGSTLAGTSSLVARTTARSMAFSSSRTLPGQL